MSATPQDDGFTAITGSDGPAVSELVDAASSLESDSATTNEATSATRTPSSAAEIVTGSVTAPSGPSSQHISTLASGSTSVSLDTSSPDHTDADGLFIGAKAGIGIGVALLCVFILFAILLFIKRRRQISSHHVVREISGREHEHCLYHQKPELEDTSTPRNSTANLAFGRLGARKSDRTTAELDGSTPKQALSFTAAELESHS
ncbi:uncharacterized protein Z518_10624 [Rhinocladiella mackenziei CBS 650.93]|uniref:Mid2 domain-containing protein n=1 Tax=Rhinocladiella mackenziei CBS 650.93 TaxID=1442369 RepID=A0A0D2I400_9EURO|nr:uncharacterized protein Z518_10624 [Rhinocladiella mackenziei CBS 650.93]KIX00484.1 hypothetical protein Z518_10624 [Rhinocladiella mackenziei CBS 650.93]